MDIMKLGTAIYSGMPINHTIFIGHGGVWRTYQSVVSFFPFKTEVKSCSVNTKNLKNVLLKLTEASHKFTEKSLIIKLKNISVRLPYVLTDKGELNIYRLLQQRVKGSNETVAEAKSSDEWKPIPKNFLTSISACSKTISDNAVHGTLSCFSFSNNEVMTSNNISLSIAKLDGDFPTCLMNKSALMGAISIIPGEYKIVGKYIIFRNDEKVLVQIPIVSGEFPDFSAVKDFTCDNYVDLDMEALATIADVSESLFEGSDMFDNSLQVVVEDGLLNIRSGATSGQVQANIKVDFEENFSFSIDSKTLQLLTETDTRIGIEGNKIVVESKTLKIISSVGE